jgi:hypothetical protein
MDGHLGNVSGAPRSHRLFGYVPICKWVSTDPGNPDANLNEFRTQLAEEFQHRFDSFALGMVRGFIAGGKPFQKDEAFAMAKAEFADRFEAGAFEASFTNGFELGFETASFESRREFSAGDTFATGFTFGFVAFDF